MSENNEIIDFIRYYYQERALAFRLKGGWQMLPEKLTPNKFGLLRNLQPLSGHEKRASENPESPDFTW